MSAFSPSMQKAIRKAAEHIDRSVNDAKRWAYVRANMVRSDPKMDGTSYFFFRNPVGRGKTIDEVIDRLIAESE